MVSNTSASQYGNQNMYVNIHNNRRVLGDAIVTMGKLETGQILLPAKECLLYLRAKPATIKNEDQSPRSPNAKRQKLDQSPINDDDQAPESPMSEGWNNFFFRSSNKITNTRYSQGDARKSNSMSDESSIGGISQYSVEDESEVQSLLNDIELNKMLLEKAKSVKDMPDSSLARPHFCSTSFSKKYPELGLKLYHDYKLPFELSDKQFHELVFSKLHLNNDSKFEVARILIEKLMELNPEQREKFERFYSRGSNFNHILAGIASKYLPEDIVEFCLSVNFSQAFTKTPSYTEDCRLTSRLLDEVFDRFGTENVAWSPSHNTCKQILEALEKNKNFVHH